MRFLNCDESLEEILGLEGAGGESDKEGKQWTQKKNGSSAHTSLSWS
jgi:hypothetical protein